MLNKLSSCRSNLIPEVNLFISTVKAIDKTRNLKRFDLNKHLHFL